MNIEEIIDEHIRVIRDSEIIIQILVIKWPSPDQPKMSWKPVKTLPITLTEDQLQAEIHSIANNSKYFPICISCGERNSLGHMLYSGTCQSCAEKNHGIVF